MGKFPSDKMKNLTLYIDIVFCAVVLPVMVFIFPVERWYHSFRWYVVSVGIWLYVVYIVNRTVTVPFLFRDRNKCLAGVILIVLSVLVTYCLARIRLYNPKPNIFDTGITRIFPSVTQYQQAVFSLFMIVETFSFAVGLLTQTNKQRARRRAVEAERDRAEIELYKAQIKPHFMFNTLNSLYGLFLTKNDNALPSLERFISMTRYLHTMSRRDLVPIVDEADYIRQFVGLQSLRLNGMTTVELDIDIEDETLMVPPMLLVTFVENCFKHGVSPVEKSVIRISIREKDDIFVFTTSNRIFPVQHIGEHMGIENCRKRLDILYPDSHSLTTVGDGHYYKVKLQIDLSR